MPERPKIKWRRQDIAELQRVVKNFNAKIARLEKKLGPDVAYLPERASVKRLKAEIETRQDFNRELNRLKRFSNKGAEAPVISRQGLVTTKWEKKEMEINLSTINRQRAALRRKYAKIAPEGSQLLQYDLQPKKIDFQEQTFKSWDFFKRQTHKFTKSNYQENKVKQYLDNFQEASDRYCQPYNKIINLLAQKAGGRFLFDIYYQDDRLQIDFLYGAINTAEKGGTILDAFAEWGIVLSDAEINANLDLMQELARHSHYYSYLQQPGVWAEEADDPDLLFDLPDGWN